MGSVTGKFDDAKYSVLSVNKWNYSLEYYKIENLECPNFGILSNKWKLYRSEWYTQNGIHHILIMVYWESNFGFHGNYAIQNTSPAFRIEDWINYNILQR